MPCQVPTIHVAWPVKSVSSAAWHQKYCYSQPSTALPKNLPRHAAVDED